MKLREALDRNPDYLSGKITHQDYFETIALCVGFRESDLPCSLNTVRKALEEGDEHLNTIPLKMWDDKHGYVLYMLRHTQGIGRFTWSLSESVCTLKCLAKYLANK